MADTSGKLDDTMELIWKGKYFIINRPRQYGKTTTLFLLLKKLEQTEQYLPFSISFEGLHNEEFQDAEAFGKAFFRLLEKNARWRGNTEIADFLAQESESITKLEHLSEAITRLVEKAGKKLVLLIDEVDKSSNNQLFVSFLGMLRTKYLAAAEERDLTFHAVVLAGVHDIKTLKLKLRPDAEQKFNSPWNIAADFKVEMSLLPHEILPMLLEYSRDKGVKMDAPQLAERLFYFTSGYPFLVSKLCKVMDEDMPPAPEWTTERLEEAVSLLLKETNANFDSLIANLENFPELHELVYRIISHGEQPVFSIHDPVIQQGIMYGILRNGGGIRIHNRIYQEIIFDYLTSKVKRKMSMNGYNFRDKFILPGNRLDLEKVLLQFQAFMREQFSEKDREFVERNGRLIFLAFLRPIINGGGWEFKEPQISEEQRLDIAITFFQHKYVMELKIWRGKVAFKSGLEQLAGYLEKQGMEEGYLLVFEHLKEKSWREEWMEVEGKRVFGVWV